ncbi:transporter substrate-binding domain-containing protein [Variovorax gossypii]|uniref:Transporter substrate-binding domain-containing protein n=1 Tax=Variovorax gossypii TaxID=1679495 RepID=A0A431TLN0_9BURK|nr:transporter substrate-binding domain-containing protein [Variovorax gossypii]RTQ34549.1 transporter substrate-binding domain-containing protein [Variovorax gossypii]
MFRQFIRRAALVLLLGLAMQGLAQAQKVAEIKKAGVLKIGAQVAQVPWGFSDKGGKLTGYDIEFAEMLAKDLGVKPEFTPVTVANRTAALLTGQVDMLAAVVTILADRQKVVLFSRPYSYLETVLIGKTGSPPMKSYADLKGMRIGVPRGSVQDSSVTQARTGATIQRFDDDAAAVQALLSGQVDLAGAANSQLGPIAQVAGAGKYEVKLVVARGFQGATVRPGEREWVGYINDFIGRKMASGELPALYKKWIGQDMDKDLPASGETEAALPRVVTK